MKSKIEGILLERFGEPIGDAPSTVGVPDERHRKFREADTCEVDEEFGAWPDKNEGSATETTGSRPVRPLWEKEKFSKKAAKSFAKGTKTFDDKVKKAKRAGLKNPEGFAAVVTKKSTGKWPSED